MRDWPQRRQALTFIGLDDTDVIDSPGTNRLARDIAEGLPAFGLEALAVMRHQLFFDERVPYTSKNGSAALVATGRAADLTALEAWLVEAIRAFAPEGSDPGLALVAAPAAQALEPALAFARCAQSSLVTRAQAHEAARASGVTLRGLGGTEDGVIGALSGLALAWEGRSGRIVHRAGWPWPDDFRGRQSAEAVLARGIDAIEAPDGALITTGEVAIRKRLRPAFREGRVVLEVEPRDEGWAARKSD